MDEEYLKVGESMYQLSNGNYLRIYSLADDPKYEFGYDYFDLTKCLVDGGVFNLDDAETEQEVLIEAMNWCDVDHKKISWSLIEEEADTGYLEEKGFTGW